VASGSDEKPIKSKSRKYLIFIGRIDEDKSPHYAILAADRLNLPIYILGEDVKRLGYSEKYKDILNMPHVHMSGVVSGCEKMKFISEACCGIYTIGSKYIEPAAGTIAEILKSGVPIAGISWKGDDAICEPIRIDGNLGCIAQCNDSDAEDCVIDKLTAAIKFSIKLNRDYIYEKGNEIYNSTELVKRMYLRVYNI